MKLFFNITAPGLKEYPIHTHKTYEIMHYLEGNGYLRTSAGKLPFVPGTVIIVPPGLSHGSSSEAGFRNISVSGDFEHLLQFSTPVVFTDNQTNEGKRLLTLLYENRFEQNSYTDALAKAYLHFLLKAPRQESKINHCIKKIIEEITKNAWDPEFDLSTLFRQSSYAEDYIRDCFRKATGKTPIRFLTELRIKKACFLIDIYADTLPLSCIAEQCGFQDYVYFTKKFKELVGMSPTAYKKKVDMP